MSEIMLDEFTEEDIEEINNAFHMKTPIEFSESAFKDDSALNLIPTTSIVKYTFLIPTEDHIEADREDKYFVCVEIGDMGHALNFARANDKNIKRKVIPIVGEKDNDMEVFKNEAVFIFEGSTHKLYNRLLLAELGRGEINRIRNSAICMEDIRSIREKLFKEKVLNEKIKEKISDLGIPASALFIGILEKDRHNIGEQNRRVVEDTIRFMKEEQRKKYGKIKREKNRYIDPSDSEYR